MKQYGCLKAIYMSFYSRALYRDVAKNWGADVMFYLLMLLAICWACLMFRMQPAMNLGAAQFTDAVVPQLPKMIYIKNGIVSTPEKRPYLVQDPENKELIGIIDTTGTYKTIEEAKSRFLLTKDSFIYHDRTAVKIQKIPSDFNLNIDPVVVKGYAIKFVGWLWVLLFPIFLLVSFIYRVIQAFFYALLGKLFAVLSKTPIVYFDILKLAMVAITPAIVISTIVDFFNMWSNGHFLVYFVLSMGYLIFAIIATKKQ